MKEYCLRYSRAIDHTACKRPAPRFVLRGADGNALLLVVIVVALLTMAMGTYMSSLGTYRRLQEARISDDRALMAAEAGLASEIATLESMPTPPTSDVTQTIALPTTQFAPFQNVTAAIHVQTFGNQQF
jgi:Tfp pilus assembly protein PilX